MKKIILLLVVIASFLLCACNNRNQNNKIVQEIYSPDGKYKATCFIRDLGATTKASTQLSVLERNGKLNNDSGNICIIYGDLKVSWENNTVLNVTIENSDEIFKQITHYNGINIKYKIDNTAQ